jgi:hypothetical protein
VDKAQNKTRKELAMWVIGHLPDVYRDEESKEEEAYLIVDTIARELKKNNTYWDAFIEVKDVKR